MPEGATPAEYDAGMNPRGLAQVSRLVGFLVLLVALLVAAGGGYAYRSTQRFLARAVTTTGTVVELVPSPGQNGQTMYAPVYTYRDRSGAQHKVQSSVSSSPAGFDVGQAVTVLYDPADAGDGRIRSFSRLWGLCTILWSIAGAMGLAAGVLILLVPFAVGRIWPADWAQARP
jgi:hypothetical protein